MENEKPEAEQKPAIDLLDVEVGEDKPQVEAKRVVIEDIKLEDVQFKGNESAKKLVLKVKHPDVPDTIDINGARYQQGDKLKSAGLWYKLDKDNKLPYGSAIANVLRHYKKAKPAEMKGEQIETVTAENGYLLVKAY